jgi:hypothetical protein
VLSGSAVAEAERMILGLATLDRLRQLAAVLRA